MVPACATVETGWGIALCAAAYWAYIRAVEKLDECQRANNRASLDTQINAMTAEAEYLTALAEGAGQTVDRSA